jgi:hypothetical protein
MWDEEESLNSISWTIGSIRAVSIPLPLAS